ncbi:hypothetical protein F383_09179 [Gossypium arboreum]|uniref:Uncharacterized protein n=1 Tax=Gossypium arboreum TaxID=29729 RepID=A0A0B0PFG8_GOSAR|nr:hypothetical protein F383_09179 [Gossypium arboreum]
MTLCRKRGRNLNVENRFGVGGFHSSFPLNLAEPGSHASLGMEILSPESTLQHCPLCKSSLAAHTLFQVNEVRSSFS